MPRVSKRQRSLFQVPLALALQSSSTSSDSRESAAESSSSTTDSSSSELFERDDCIFEATLADISELYFIMYNTRYLVPRVVTPKSTEFASAFFHNLPDRLFRQLTRMDKPSFFKLVEMISDHSIFSNNSLYQQAPVVLQLAVCLDRVGHEGNGACLNRLIPTWGVSTGSLVNFSKRCFVALESVLAEEVQWPNREQREVIKQHFTGYGFSGCVGLIDGSLIPLSQGPKVDGECYYDRKSSYSVNAQVVCDHKRRIIYLFTDKEQFNRCVAKARVTNENCIGVLKSRWHSLKAIRIQLKSRKDNDFMVRWISLAARLHNFVISQNDHWTTEDEELDGHSQVGPSELQTEQTPSQGPSRREVASVGNALLAEVMEEALNLNRAPGGLLHPGAIE